jgi:5'-nucleotidase / UDP-sugar diphosphatase
MHTKKFTILHSNDMHGDILPETDAQKKEQIGGLALLSGYVKEVRKQEENTLFVIAGDMLQGSLIDSEYKGISTIEIMNYLSPDVATLGNHEFDYGLPHLLFLEKMANFPIVNANLYIKPYAKRLMKPYIIIKKAGFDILFTGIITDKIIDALKTDALIGSFVSLEDASTEVGKITNAYKNDDIDLTILLTHIGYESDIELAKLLHPEWGVDMIIGGHSHTVLPEPATVNNILIAQAGTGTNQIGRFDITVEDDTNSIIESRWQLVPINEDTAEPDTELIEYISSFKKRVDMKYSTVISRFQTVLTHPKREEETTLGNLFADIFAENAQVDVMLVGSGSIRVRELGPVITLGSLQSAFPYDDVIRKYSINGNMLKQVFTYIMRRENRTGEGECYQVNAAAAAVYSDTDMCLQSLSIHQKPVDDEMIYTIAMQGFHYTNAQAYLGVSQTELVRQGEGKIVTTSAFQVLEEYIRNHQNLIATIEGRLQYTE